MTLTIYDIARLADVSPSTVSRALNGKPGVSRKNRDAINQIVRQYNFQTPVSNPDASLNKEQRVVGILTDDLDSDHQNDAVAKCQGELLINGYQCISKFIGDDDDAMERSLAEMADKQVSGLLLIGDAFLDHERLKEAIKRWVPDTPIVLVYQNQRIGELPNVYCVGPNERKGFAYCVQRMYERGRRNIALVIEEGRTGEKKIQEYFEQSVKQYPDVNTAVFTQVPYSVSGGKDIAFQVLRQLPDVDGVLCTRDKTAIGLMYYMEDTGKRIPEDISIIGEDNSDLCEVTKPPLTSIDTMIKVAVLMSVRVLVDVMEGRVQTHKITLDMELVERGSL